MGDIGPVRREHGSSGCFGEAWTLFGLLMGFGGVTPVFGLLLAVLLFRESLGVLGALGVGLTIAGVAWVERPSRGGG